MKNKKLKKGDRLLLQQKNANLQKIGIGIGWDHEAGNQHPFDLDVSIVMTDSDHYMPSKEHFVYYRNVASPDKAVRHSGDNRSGVGAGDDESVFIDLGLADPQIKHILFIISIHEAQLKNQHFGQLPSAYIRAFEWDTKEELVRYNIKSSLKYFDTGEFARLVRKGEEGWEFIATATGEHGGLNTILTMYKKPGD